MLSKNLESIIPQLEELTRSLFPKILKIYRNPRSSAQEKKDGSPVTAAIFIDDDFKVVTAAIKAGIKQVAWITPGKNRILQNGVETFPSLADLVNAIS